MKKLLLQFGVLVNIVAATGFVLVGKFDYAMVCQLWALILIGQNIYLKAE